MNSAASMQRLGVAVITAAVYDAAGLVETRSAMHGGKWGRSARVAGQVRGTVLSVAEIQAEAYAWLTTPSERLEFWAECAGLDMDTVIRGADAAVEYAKRTPRGESIFADVRRIGKR